MNEQLRQVFYWMQTNARTVRNEPPSTISSIERFTQVERLVESLWEVAQHLGMNLGKPPPIITTGEGSSPPAVLLAVLTKHIAEVYATFHMTGLAPTHSSGLRRFCLRKPNEPSPNWKVIVDETFPPIDDAFEETVTD